MKIQRYWKPEKSTVEITKKEATTEIREILRDSVKKRTMADVPIGAFLSGGLDSTVIVALLNKEVEDLRTYSVGFQDAEKDESDEAEFVASHYGTNHTTLTVDQNSLSGLESLMHHNGEPLADPAMLPTKLLSEKAADDVKVVLTGEGADELFAGYQHHDYMQRHRRYAEYFPKIAFDGFDIASKLGIYDKHLRYASSLRSDRELLSTIGMDYCSDPGCVLNCDASSGFEDALETAFNDARESTTHRQLSLDRSSSSESTSL